MGAGKLLTIEQNGFPQIDSAQGKGKKAGDGGGKMSMSKKLSPPPEALHGVNNVTIVRLPPDQALGEAAVRAARFQQSLAQGSWCIFCPHVPPARLQVGPQCGLVALSLAAATRGLTCTPGEVQELAIKRGFSLQGEMFSASDMANLSKEVLGGGELMKSLHSLTKPGWSMFWLRADNC